MENGLLYLGIYRVYTHYKNLCIQYLTQGWNVKALYDEADPAFKIIRIEPDWNVKSQPSREGSVTPPLE